MQFEWENGRGGRSRAVIGKLFGLLMLLVTLLGSGGATEAADPVVRIGILGLDNYQSVAFTQLFHDPKAAGDLAGIRVTAAFPDEPSPDIAESVENLPKWVQSMKDFQVPLVDSVDQVLAQCDAVLVMPVDGRRHRKLAEAAIRAGKRTYIGRPMAASLEDVAALLKTAEEAGVPLWSSSQHRFSPGFIGMRNHPEVGKVLGCDVYGGCPMVPHHSDFFWHAVHSLETLYTIMGPGCETVRCLSTPQAESITGVWRDGRIGTYRGIRQGGVKYSATVFGDQGVSIAGVYGHGIPVKGVAPTDDKYMGYEGIAIEIARFAKGGPVPVTPAETLELYAFMEAARESRQKQGAPVAIAEVLKRVMTK
ncbi:MAG TPA: dehydrogenase [Planctomycetaceae bacterium]|nr:dehydrogenase [Planctomycetaceae bacterium]